MKMRTVSTADVRRRASETTTTTRSPRRSAHGEARPAGTRRSARQQQHTTTGGSATIALQRQQSVHAAARLLKTIGAPLRRRRRLPAAASVTTHDQRRTNGKQRRSRHRRAMLIDPVLIDRRTSRTQMEGRCGHRCEEVTTRCGAAPSDGEAVRSPTWIQVHDLIFIRDNARKGFVKVRLENSLKPPRPLCGRKSALRNSLKPRASHHLRPGRSHTRKATHDTYTCTYPATSARVLAAAHTPRLKQATHRYAACPWHPWRALGFGAGCVRIRR